MGRKTIRELSWHPRNAIYRRSDGTVWTRYSQSTHAKVEQRGRFRAWTQLGESMPIKKHELDEEVEVIFE
jgi:hypothetical protein